MTAEQLGGPGSQSGAPLVLQLVSTFWGLAALLALGGYTLAQTLSYERPGQFSRESERSAASVAAYTGPYPAPQAEPMIIHLACNQQDASQVRTPPGRYPFTIRLDQVPQDIRALLQGTDTVFPKDARIVLTPCIQGLVDSGQLP